MILSIITINYNNHEGLRKTIESVISQSCKEFEFIIIDGGSTDGGIDVIKQNEQYIDFWLSEKDNGVYNAMNKGIRIAKGNYCLFMNSGDVFYDENVVKNVFPLLKDTDVITGSTWLSFGRLVKAPEAITMDFLYKATLCHQSSFIRRELLLKYPYDETMKYVSDWKFWIQTLIYDNCSYESTDTIISVYDWNGMSTVYYKDVDKEKERFLSSILPARILKDFHKHVIGDNWEDKLYIAIKGSKFHSVIYSMNVCIIKFLQMFKKGAFWIKEYPIKLK